MNEIAHDSTCHEVPSDGPVVDRALTLLVVEDSYLIASAIGRQLEQMGHTIVGPVASVEDAIDLLSKCTVDAAILDISLGNNTTSEPIARRLVELGRPFLFLTGHSTADLMPAQFSAHQRILKPVNENELRAAIQRLHHR